MLISHKCLWNSIELLGHVKQSIQYIDEDCKCKKLLNYTIRLLFFLRYLLKSVKCTSITKLDMLLTILIMIPLLN